VRLLGKEVEVSVAGTGTRVGAECETTSVFAGINGPDMVTGVTTLQQQELLLGRAV
jgi:hypothetical protein